MENELNILSDPQKVCSALVLISSKFRIASKGSFGVIGTAVDPNDFEEDILLESLRIIDRVVLPRANKLSQALDRPNPEAISELIRLAFSDTVSDIKERYHLSEKISLENVLRMTH